MRPFVIALCLLASCNCCDAQILPRRSFGFDPNKKVDGHDDGAGKTLYNIGRAPELPTGPAKLHCWIVVSDNWQTNPLEYQIAQHIANDPRMKAIKAGTYWNYYTASNPKFRDSGLVGAVGTATPIMVLTNGDGMIKADGTGGMFVNAKSFPATADDAIDMLCDAIAQFNPPPKFEGQTLATPVIRDTEVEQCPDGQCPTPVVTIPGGSEGTLTPIRPRNTASVVAVALGGIAFVALCAGLAALGIATPGKPKE